MNNPLAIASQKYMAAQHEYNVAIADGNPNVALLIDRCIEAKMDLKEALAKYETHVLVPREPTIQMVIAGRDAKDGWANITPIYNAMIEAAEEKV